MTCIAVAIITIITVSTCHDHQPDHHDHVTLSAYNHNQQQKEAAKGGAGSSVK
jgi:hypothetical protein